MRLGSCLLLLLVPLAAAGQSAWLDAASRSMGGAGMALGSGAPYPLNPAALPDEGAVSIGSTRLYGVPDLTPLRIGIGLGRGAASAALAVTGLQLEGYSDLRMSLAASTRVGGPRMGIRVGLARRKAGPYRPTNALLVVAGLRHELTPQWSAALLAGRALGRGSPRGEVPVLGVGAAWSDGRLTLPVEIRRAGAAPPSFHAGMQVRPVPVLALRVGMSTAPDLVAVGIGLALGRMGIDMAVDRHPDLGHSLSLDLRMTVR
jgi:hypothetical protein